MSASRMSYNLFKRAGWYTLRHCLKYRAYRWDWRLMFEDMFMPVVCAVRGHDEFDANPGGYPPEPACRRCHRWLPPSEPVPHEP